MKEKGRTGGYGIDDDVERKMRRVGVEKEDEKEAAKQR